MATRCESNHLCCWTEAAFGMATPGNPDELHTNAVPTCRITDAMLLAAPSCRRMLESRLKPSGRLRRCPTLTQPIPAVTEEATLQERQAQRGHPSRWAFCPLRSRPPERTKQSMLLSSREDIGTPHTAMLLQRQGFGLRQRWVEPLQSVVA